MVRKVRRRWNAPVYGDIPIGAIDGVNAKFIISYIPLFAETVQVYLNGLLMSLGEDKDFTFEGKTITFNSNQIPQPGDTLIVNYLTK